MFDYLKRVVLATTIDMADLTAEWLEAGVILLRGMGDELMTHLPEYEGGARIAEGYQGLVYNDLSSSL